MKFVEDGTLQTLSKHLFAASGAMYSIATHLMTLQMLFSHPAEFARGHRKSPEVQGFKQNPSCESMVAYIASQTLTHNEIVAEDEQGANIWDILTQHVPSRETWAIAPLWDIVEEQGEDTEEPDEEDNLPPPSHRRARRNILDEEDDELQEEEPFNMPKSSVEHTLFITQQDPETYHKPGTLSRSQKRKTPATSKKRTLTTNIWASVLINQPHLPAVVLLLQRSEQPPVVAEALAAQPVAVDEVHEENMARQHRNTFSLSSVST